MISIKHAMLELVWQIFVAWENLLYPLPEIVECLTRSMSGVDVEGGYDIELFWPCLVRFSNPLVSGT